MSRIGEPVGVPGPVDLLPHGVAGRADVAAATSRSTVGRWLARGELVLVAPGVVATGPRDEMGGACVGRDAVLGSSAQPRVGAHGGRARASDGWAAARDGRARSLPPRRRGRRGPPLGTAGVDDPLRRPRGRRAGAQPGGCVVLGVVAPPQRPGCGRATSGAAGGHRGGAGRDGARSGRAPGVGPDAAPCRPGPARRAARAGRAREPERAGGLRRAARAPAFHGSREARERDLRRDSGLAVLGWVVLRFSYERLVSDPAGCRQEIEAVVRHRLADR
ncbi:DUF559 domain-containing protein [Blastococcus goldschmidtiae]|uniref:DUF559 domain-containing protein n=1 Tax=Blastococcus goldschmidtiae TaxID=3075546 RepID=A0ABU2K6Y3_9ACTN|nr:DUF559 domain-containing protein [Blastococcus sp. DSM 46792]MDT0275945.1 DUF559 domain-containing protein [Blastococcus sp. DSM 46792]